MKSLKPLAAALSLLCATSLPAWSADTKGMSLNPATPQPARFRVKDQALIDQRAGPTPLFFRGMGYSPYLKGETPLFGAAPGDDGRYQEHLAAMRSLGVNFLHVFPQKMPKGFFSALDQTPFLYGQDVWIQGQAEDLLDETFQANTLRDIQSVIDHVYQVGRPDRLVFFSIGDELQAAAVTRTDSRHPQVRDFQGKHLTLTNRTPTEVALARLVDAAMDYELTRHGQRHLYCHTSWTHIGPLANRPDLELPTANVLVPDMGDLLCMNIYTYARGVVTSPPGSVTGSSYQGYLEELVASSRLPLLITQVGLSTSPFEPKPWVPGFGGHKEEDVPKTFRGVWKDVRTAKGREQIAGLVFFELNDEWWKSGETPDDSEAHQREDPEEWFGIYALGDDRKLVPKGPVVEAVREVFAQP